jgi:hypothetical protein
MSEASGESGGITERETPEVGTILYPGDYCSNNSGDSYRVPLSPIVVGKQLGIAPAMNWARAGVS